MSVIVYHVDDEVVHDVIDGKLYSVPPREPVEFASSFIGRKFIEHKHFHGVVEVNTIRTRTGVTFDLEEAEVRATQLLHHAEMQGINQYFETQQTDRMQHGKPAIIPQGRYAKLIRKHQVRLEDYGIHAVGTIAGNAALGKDPALLEMQKQVATLQELLLMVLADGGITAANKDQLKSLIRQPKPQGQGVAKSTFAEVPLEPPVNATLGEATEGTEGIPGGDDGVLDLSRGYQQLGVVPGSEEDPNSIPGARIQGQGNLNREQVSNVISQIRPPARKGKVQE